jgi:SulP family sulfate permease
VLGRITGTTSWVPLSVNPEAAQLPGVLAVLFATPLWYANAVHFRAEVVASLGRAVGSPRLMVLDALGMSDLDYTGSRALTEILDELDHDHITFAIARAGQHACDGLRRSGLLERIGEDHLFASVDEAVQALGPAAASAPEPGPQSH